jgi:hypothetical protein
MDLKISSIVALLFACLGLFSASSAGCQDLDVSGFVALPNDMTARTLAPVRDANGELTALIKVVTVQDGFIFEGGSLGIVKAEQKEGEWWVYIPAGARTITIRHPRLGVLRNYAYPVAITSGTVYEMKLVHGVVETVIRERQILSEFVVIESDPPGADVYLNNEPVGKTPFSSDKPEGRYEWRVETNLYLPEAGIFELKAGEKVRLDVVLKPNFGSLFISSSPEGGAEILINGMRMNKSTPVTIPDLPTGEHTLTLSHPWYETKTQKVTVLAGETQNVEVAMKPNFADLTITAESNEEVFVNGARKGLGTWNGRLSPGVYQVEVRKASHKTATRQLSLKSGDKESIKLEPTPILSVLKIQSTPLDAEIYLNGKNYGNTPQIVRDLLIGTYELELRKAGFGAMRRQVEVREGETVELNETLSSNGSLSFTSNVDGTEVYVDGAYKGTTPLTLSDLTPASYNYELKKAGYETAKGWAYVEAGNTAEVKANLFVLGGSVSLFSQPAGAEVFIDGAYRGVTPLLLNGLSPNAYIVEFRKSGYVSQKKRVYIKSGEKTQETAVMKQTRQARTAARSDAGFMLYTYEDDRPIGLSFGELKNRAVSMYANFALSPSVLTTTLYELDDNGSTDSPWGLVRTGEVREGNFSTSLGLTIPVIYPLWAYVGAGFGITRYLVEVEEYGFATGDYLGDEWYENPTRSGTELFPEVGLMLKLGNALVLKYGITPENGNIPMDGRRHQFGFGFQF